MKSKGLGRRLQGDLHPPKWQRQISPNLTAEGAEKMVPIKSTGRTLTEMQELEAMAAKLIKTARKLPPGPVRHDLLKEIGKFRARIIALKAKGK
jgi:hypothetical protein